MLQRSASRRCDRAACCSATRCKDPERYGVVEVDADGTADLDRGEAGAAQVELRRHRPVLLRQPGGRHRRALKPVGARRAGDHRREQRLPRAGQRRALIDLGPRHSPGWTPAPTTRCWRPASSCRCSSTGRACGSPAWRRSRCGMGFIDAAQATRWARRWRSPATASTSWRSPTRQRIALRPSRRPSRLRPEPRRLGHLLQPARSARSIGGWVENSLAMPSPGRNGLAIIRWRLRDQRPAPAAAAARLGAGVQLAQRAGQRQRVTGELGAGLRRPGTPGTG